jgi:DNA-binding NarL/FixJ family response regulator
MDKSFISPVRPPLRVFVVEDSAAIRERIEGLVESIDGACCAGSADSATQATVDIERIRPDAVILDIRLAQGTGFDVIRLLRQRGVDTSFYVITNHAIEPYRRLAVRLGAEAFLDKTTQFETLRGLLAHRAATRSHPSA